MSDRTNTNEPTKEDQAAADGGKHDPGTGGEDRDILGKDQQDLNAEDLKGDTREPTSWGE